MPEPEADEPRRGKRNPPWSRDELILALDLYMRLRNTPIAKNAEEIAELSGFLGRMATSLGRMQSGIQTAGSPVLNAFVELKLNPLSPPMASAVSTGFCSHSWTR